MDQYVRCRRATLSLIAIFSSTIDKSLSLNSRLALKVFINVLAYIPLVVFGMVAVRIVRKWRETRGSRRELIEP